MEGRVMAIDLGEKRIGLAISDPERLLSKPLGIIAHSKLEQDCQTILELARFNEVKLIVIGQALGPNGEETPSYRHALRVGRMLNQLSDIEIQCWDESFSTIDAQFEQLRSGAKKKKRGSHMDAHAAATFLSEYLEFHNIRRV